jgi:hypothetical protein
VNPFTGHVLLSLECVHPLDEHVPLSDERIPALTDRVFEYAEILNLFRECVPAFA